MMRILALLILSLPISSYANDHNPWEVSLGTTQMFFGWYGEDSSQVPTSSATLILSRELIGGLSAWGVFNLPLTPNKRVTAEGVIEDTITLPTLMLGLSYEALSYQYDERKRIGLDAGLSVGRPLTLKGQVFPVGAFRLKLVKDNENTVYVGLTTSPYNPEGDLVWGLIYGMGTKF
jgi:hypothetical protein